MMTTKTEKSGRAGGEITTLTAKYNADAAVADTQLLGSPHGVGTISRNLRKRKEVVPVLPQTERKPPKRKKDNVLQQPQPQHRVVVLECQTTPSKRRHTLLLRSTSTRTKNDDVYHYLDGIDNAKKRLLQLDSTTMISNTAYDINNEEENIPNNNNRSNSASMIVPSFANKKKKQSAMKSDASGGGNTKDNKSAMLCIDASPIIIASHHSCTTTKNRKIKTPPTNTNASLRKQSKCNMQQQQQQQQQLERRTSPFCRRNVKKNMSDNIIMSTIDKVGDDDHHHVKKVLLCSKTTNDEVVSSIPYDIQPHPLPSLLPEHKNEICFLTGAIAENDGMHQQRTDHPIKDKSNSSYEEKEQQPDCFRNIPLPITTEESSTQIMITPENSQGETTINTTAITNSSSMVSSSVLLVEDDNNMLHNKSGLDSQTSSTSESTTSSGIGIVRNGDLDKADKTMMGVQKTSEFLSSDSYCPTVDQKITTSYVETTPNSTTSSSNKPVIVADPISGSTIMLIGATNNVENSNYTNMSGIVRTSVDASTSSSVMDQHQCDINADLINVQAGLLFTQELFTDRPCISARIFACFALLGEKLYGKSGSFDESGLCRTPTVTQPLLPLLQSLVNVEAISLRPFESQDSESIKSIVVREGKKREQSRSTSTKETAETKPADDIKDIEPTKLRKRIQFSGIDCSSTLPPVDRVGGSSSHQQESINAMVAAVERIQALERDKHGDLESLQCLERLIHFLSILLADDEQKLMNVCAEAINTHFSPDRVETARTVYLRDFKLLRSRLTTCSSIQPDTQSTENSLLHNDGDRNDINQEIDFSLNVEERLAHFVGQTIRYHLRMVLNPQPPRLSPKDKTYKEKTENFSKVSKLVELTMPVAGQANEALEDACISALVSTALQRIYDFCGPEALHMLAIDVENADKHCHLIVTMHPDIPTSFCTQKASQRQIPTRPPFYSFDDEEIADVLDDIRDATTFLAAAKASRFLVDLFTSKGVQNEIERMGGWSRIEAYAKLSRQYKLWQICDFDAHLVPLCEHQGFLSRLQQLCILLEKQVPSCAASLACLAKRFRATTSSKIILSNYPEIRVIRDAVAESREIVETFPLVGVKRGKKKKAF